MRFVRLLIALLALSALFFNAQACLLNGAHVAKIDTCSSHDGEHDASEHERDDRCGGCGNDLLSGGAVLAAPLPPSAEFLALETTAGPAFTLALPAHAQAPTIDPPPDPHLVARAFTGLSRTLPARGPNAIS